MLHAIGDALWQPSPTEGLQLQLKPYVSMASNCSRTDSPRTDLAAKDPDGCVARDTGGQGVHASAMRGLEREAVALVAQLRRMVPLLQAAAGGHAVSMAAGDLLRDVQAHLTRWDTDTTLALVRLGVVFASGIPPNVTPGIPESGSIMTVDEFRRAQAARSTTGEGYYATSSGMSSLSVDTSDPPSWATHVVWFELDRKKV